MNTSSACKRNSQDTKLTKAFGGCAIALAIALASTTLPSTAYGIVYEKDENVYATLDRDGEVEKIYVVNQFDVLSPGTIEDVGDYDCVTNLSNDSSISIADDTQTMDVGEGVFYYQGDIDGGELPWDFDITYSLDGKKVNAEELAGKSGHVEVHIVSSVNDKAPTEFTQTHILQISLNVPAEACRNIVAEGATISDTGSDRRITFTIMPGQNADVSFSTEAESFEMSGISIAGAPAVAAGTKEAPEPISFVSADNNENIARVQFALTTDAIEIPEVKKEVSEEPEKNFIERVLALFGL